MFKTMCTQHEIAVKAMIYLRQSSAQQQKKHFHVKEGESQNTPTYSITVMDQWQFRIKWTLYSYRYIYR